MKARRHLIAAVTLILLASGCAATPSTPARSASSSPAKATSSGPFPDPPDTPLDAAVAAPLQAELDRWIKEGFLPGVTAALVTKDGTWAGAAGVDGLGKPLQPESGMSIASITKTFIAAEVMTLAANRQVDLDAPASTYLPGALTANGASVRQLLGMRSGLPDLLNDGPLITAVLADPDQHWTVEEALTTARLTPSTPGEFDYSNTNYWLLAQLITTITGHPYAEALRSDLIAPAALARVAVQDDEQSAAPLARPAPDTPDISMPTTGPFLPSRALASVSAGSGNIAADAPSIARWGYLLYGGHVLPPASLNEMTRDMTDDHYGLGTMKLSALTDEALGHLGEIEGYRAVMVVIPDRQMAVAMLAPTAKELYGMLAHLLKAAPLP